MTTTIIDRPKRQPLKFYRALAATRGARWKHIERDYHRFKDQQTADLRLDREIRERVWNHYRGDLPFYRWRNGLQVKFRHSFGEGDYDSIPGFDEVARCIAGEFPGQFGHAAGYDEESTVDHARALFDYLQQPPLKSRPAHDVLLELIEKHARREPEPDTGFNVDELEEPDRLDKLALIRSNGPAPQRERRLPPARGYVEFTTNIGALCLTGRESVDPKLGGQAEHRDGAQHIQLVPTADPDHVYAVATNGKAVAIVQCTGHVERHTLVPGPIVPRSGARPSTPHVAAVEGDHWTTGKGVQCGRLNEDVVEFPGLNIAIDDRSEGFSLDIADIVKMGKALGAKRLAFYVPPGEIEGPKSIAVMGVDPEAAVGYGIMVTQEHVPTGSEFAAAARHILGMEEPDIQIIDETDPLYFATA